jgi:hypothetical protein
MMEVLTFLCIWGSISVVLLGAFASIATFLRHNKW